MPVTSTIQSSIAPAQQLQLHQAGKHHQADAQHEQGGGFEVSQTINTGKPSQSGDQADQYARQAGRLLAENLGLSEHQWQISFQSRLGPKQWLQPYTDHTLEEVGRELGVTRERVRQVQMDALRRLRRILETQGYSRDNILL